MYLYSTIIWSEEVTYITLTHVHCEGTESISFISRFQHKTVQILVHL